MFKTEQKKLICGLKMIKFCKSNWELNSVLSILLDSNSGTLTEWSYAIEYCSFNKQNGRAAYDN